MAEYKLIWKSVDGPYPDYAKPRIGTPVTQKTYPSLDAARKKAAQEGSAFRLSGEFLIGIYEVSDKGEIFVGDVYGSWSYCTNPHDGIMWCPAGSEEGDLVHGVTTSSGRLNKTLYRLTRMVRPKPFPSLNHFHFGNSRLRSDSASARSFRLLLFPNLYVF